MITFARAFSPRIALALLYKLVCETCEQIAVSEKILELTEKIKAR